MSDLSTLKKTISLQSMPRREHIVLLFRRQTSHLLTNSTTIFTFVEMGVQWDLVFIVWVHTLLRALSLMQFNFCG
jgi:hypothetical protein